MEEIQRPKKKRKLSAAERRRRKRKMMIRRALVLLAGLCIIALIVVVICLAAGSGSKKRTAENETTEAVSEEETESETTKAKTEHTAEEYEAAGVNELNDVPILMYHRIYDMKNSETEYTGGNVDSSGYNRTSEAFEADLEQYYEWGYRCIRLTDYVDGVVDCEFGYSPIIITFDDGYNQAHIDGWDDNGDPIFSENSALAILEKVKKEHPDFNVTATFFLNNFLFENGTEEDQKLMNWMIDNGYDIGNHTWSHVYFPDATESEIVEEVGSMYELLDELIPGRYVNIIALPYGEPRDMTEKDIYDNILNCTYNGKTYTTKATLLCSWMREDSVFSNTYSNTYIKRIRGYDNDGVDFDIQMNFEALNNGYRYISDGDPDTIVYPENWEQYLGNDFGLETIPY